MAKMNSKNADRMNRQELEEIARKWISLWCVPVNWELFDQLHCKNFEDQSPAERDSSKAAYADALRNYIEAFPDLQTRVEDLVVDEPEQRISIRWASIGTNKKLFLGVGPTNRKTRIEGIEIIEIENGCIRKRWGEWDISDHL